MDIDFADVESDSDSDVWHDEPYNACQVKKYWNRLTREKWIEACRDLYGELHRQSDRVKSFGLWEKALLEFFFLAPHAWPDPDRFPSAVCMECAPGEIVDMQRLSDTENIYDTWKRKEMMLMGNPDKHDRLMSAMTIRMRYFQRLSFHPQSMQECIESIGVDKKQRSRMAQEEAKTVLDKCKFGQGFKLQSSCVIAVKNLVSNHVGENTGTKLRDAVHQLPLPYLVLNLIDPISESPPPPRFDSARCPMYQLVVSFARGEWLTTPLQFESIVTLRHMQRHFTVIAPGIALPFVSTPKT